ncbi:hypothetical protein SERLA73DRAFT_188219, partial [Serpula lacrymans var. lacrymans S7.3]
TLLSFQHFLRYSIAVISLIQPYSSVALYPLSASFLPARSITAWAIHPFGTRIPQPTLSRLFPDFLTS